MSVADVAGARVAYDDKRWRAAHAAFAEREFELEPHDLERFARTALLIGDEAEYIDGLAIAARAFEAEGNLARAAECACYAAMNLAFRGEFGPSSAWSARAYEWLEHVEGDCAARALALGGEAIRLTNSGHPDQGLPLFEQAHRIARRCGDRDAMAMTALGAGRSLVESGRLAAGLARLDEVMLAVINDDLNPIVTGIAYCGVIECCHDNYEARRADEWTRALSRWCDSQPDLVPFKGQCLVHRAQIMQMRGNWPDAMEQVGVAEVQLSGPRPHPALGSVHFERAELYRLRGDFKRAEASYDVAASFGHETQPGLALMRLEQGRIDQARAGLNRALTEIIGPNRARLLSAAVEVDLAAHDHVRADEHATELRARADELDSTLLDAMACTARGSVLLSSGEPLKALPDLRRAWGVWQDLDAPYPAARVRVLVGQACRELGDVDAARMELDAARAVFDRLGAHPDLQRLARIGGATTMDQPGGLTDREVQVLRQVASGKTNRAIATELFLSEKTVARHVANIFTKLGISSRAAATAWAYEHDLMDRA
jgi:DNA-binding CsgD family transcriptional regulator